MIPPTNNLEHRFVSSTVVVVEVLEHSDSTAPHIIYSYAPQPLQARAILPQMPLF